MPRSIEATLETSQLPDESFWINTRPVVLDDINNPNVDGIKSDLNLADSMFIAHSADRILPPDKPLETHSEEVQITPGLGENSKLISTGWKSNLEGRRFFENYNQNLRVGKTPKEALAITKSELELNIRHFIREFVQAGVVLPDSKRIQEVNGVRRMVGSNGVTLVNCITAKERRGANLEATIRVDQFFSGLIEDTGEPIRKVAVINSPRGWNGITRPYLDNQTIISWVDEVGILHGATLVTDLDQSQSRQLSIDLGVKEDFLTGESEAERVSNIVKNPALLTFPKSNQNPAEFVFDKIIAIRGTSDIGLEQLDGSVEYRSVAGAKAEIKRLDELLKFNQNCEKFLAKLKDFIFRQIDNLRNGFSQQRIMNEIDRTILLMTDDHLQNSPTDLAYFDQITAIENSESWKESDDGLDGWLNLQSRLSRALAFLETRAGCSQGVGSSNRAQSRGISLGSDNTSGEGESIGGVCRVCGLSKVDDHYHCGCGQRFESELSKPKSAWTPGCFNCGAKFGCAAA